MKQNLVKKYIILLLAALMLLGACGEKYEYLPVQSSSIEYTGDDIILEVHGGGLTGEQECIAAKVTNNSEKNVYYNDVGNGLCIFNAFIDGQWCYRHSTAKKTGSSTSILYSIAPGKSVQQITEVGLLPAGTYRIRAYFWFLDFNDPYMTNTNAQRYYLEYEFVIE